MDRVLVLYAFHQKPTALSNLLFFIEHGMHTTDNIHYCLISNGPNNLTPQQLIKFQTVITRQNVGHDFGAWKIGLQQCDALTYDYVVCLNDTVRGPHHVSVWIPKFTSLLSPTCLLSGISINCCNSAVFVKMVGETTIAPHVQSMFWCTNRMGLKILWELLMQDSKLDKCQLIAQKEIGLSLVLLRAGYNISSILIRDQRDYRDKSKWLEYARENHSAFSRTGGDPWHSNTYYGRDITTEECIFQKILAGASVKILAGASVKILAGASVKILAGASVKIIASKYPPARRGPRVQKTTPSVLSRR
jgi:hypothetical protein